MAATTVTAWPLGLVPSPQEGTCRAGVRFGGWLGGTETSLFLAHWGRERPELKSRQEGREGGPRWPGARRSAFCGILRTRSPRWDVVPLLEDTSLGLHTGRGDSGRHPVRRLNLRGRAAPAPWGLFYGNGPLFSTLSGLVVQAGFQRFLCRASPLGLTLGVREELLSGAQTLGNSGNGSVWVALIPGWPCFP